MYLSVSGTLHAGRGVLDVWKDHHTGLCSAIRTAPFRGASARQPRSARSPVARGLRSQHAFPLSIAATAGAATTSRGCRRAACMAVAQVRRTIVRGVRAAPPRGPSPRSTACGWGCARYAGRRSFQVCHETGTVGGQLLHRDADAQPCRPARSRRAITSGCMCADHRPEVQDCKPVQPRVQAYLWPATTLRN